jgi:multiple sugar transport system permease protein/putative aldouronate transport system permease protein
VPKNRLENSTKAGPWRRRWNHRGLYLLILVPIVYVFIFNYIPMYGVLMAFKNFSPRLGILGSPWVGFYNFERFFSSPNFFNILRNTLLLNIYGLIAGFPFPILMALCVNHFVFRRFKKAVQTITFAPYFLSAVIMVGLIRQVLVLDSGAFNQVLKALGFAQINFMGVAALFPHIHVWSGIWQGTGYSAIIYISALAAVDPTLHEAAVIDGASLWQRSWHIDLTTIRPIIVIMLILSMGGMLATGFEKIYLMQNPLNITTSEVITTYVYKVGLGVGGRADYSFGTAIGLFQNVVGVILTLSVNKIADWISGEGMF